MKQEAMPRKEPKSADYYDSFAVTGKYERDAEAVGWPAAADALISKTLAVRGGEVTGSVLDLATGTGLAIEALKKQTDPARVIAVDASARMLDLLRAKKIPGKLEVQHDTVQAFVEITGERFDLITFLSAAEFMPNLPVTLRRTARLLNKGGSMVFTYLPLTEGQQAEEFVDHTNKLGEAGTAVIYRVPATEVGQSITDSGLTIIEHARLADMQPVDLDYNFVIASRPIS